MSFVIAYVPARLRDISAAGALKARVSHPICAPSEVVHPGSAAERWSSSRHSSSSTSCSGAALSKLPVWPSSERSSRMLPRAPVWAMHGVDNPYSSKCRTVGIGFKHWVGLLCCVSSTGDRQGSSQRTLCADEPARVRKRRQQCDHSVALPLMPRRILGKHHNVLIIWRVSADSCAFTGQQPLPRWTY